jgi:hypothetical protein
MWPGSCPAPNILRETVNRASAGADADSLARHARHDERDATPVRRPASVGCPVAQNHVAPALTSPSIALGAIDCLNRHPGPRRTSRHWPSRLSPRTRRSGRHFLDSPHKKKPRASGGSARPRGRKASSGWGANNAPTQPTRWASIVPLPDGPLTPRSLPAIRADRRRRSWKHLV